MAKRLIALILKTGIVLGTIQGLNPSLSFHLLNTFVSLYIFLCYAPLYY
jgi:hypothetical protein